MIKFEKIILILFSFLVCGVISTHMHLRMRTRHPKFKARQYSKLSLFDHIYDKRAHTNFRFAQVWSPASAGSNAKMANSPVKKKGWIRFIVLNPDNPKKFTNFYNNDAFDAQKNLKFNKDAEDEYGKIDVPDATHFFAVATDEALYIVSARRNDIAKTQATVPYKTLWAQSPNMNKFEGGVEDVGNFKEGFCFKLKQRVEGTVEWVICADTAEAKKEWMMTIANLKMKAQGGFAGMKKSNSLSTEIEVSGPFSKLGGSGGGGGGGGGGGKNVQSNYGERNPDGIEEDPKG